MAASIEEIITKLRDMTECPVCLEQFKQPKALPCHHSFCTECLQGVLGTGQTIRCPCCNKETPVPNGVQQLPADFRANSWLEISSEYERAKVAREAEAVAAQADEDAAGPQDAFGRMSLEERCPFCEKIPSETKKLSCGHSVCSNCVQFLLPVLGDTLHCPTCSRQTTIVTTSNTAPPTLPVQSQGEKPPENEPLFQSLYELLGGRSHQPVSTSQNPDRAAAAGLGRPQPSAPLLQFFDGHRSPSPPEQQGARSEGLHLFQLLPMLELLTRAIGAEDSPSPPNTPGAENGSGESRLTFHPRCGENAAIYDNQITAHRKEPLEGFHEALVLTSRHLKPNELFEVRLDKKVDKWCGSIEIGVTTHSPTESAIPTDTSDFGPGTWHMDGNEVYQNEQSMCKTIKRYEKNLNTLKVGDRVGVQRREDGSLHFYINGADLGVAASDVPADVYGVISLYGEAGQVTIMDTSVGNPPIFRIGQKVRVKPGVVTPKYSWGPITHRSVGIVTAVDEDLTVAFPEHGGWIGQMSDMEPVPGSHPDTRNPASEEPVEAKPYKKRTDFVSNDDYAIYIRDNIEVGKLVHCRQNYEEVKEGDIGQVTKLDRDGLHDPNIEAFWQQKKGTYWVRYVHVELLGLSKPDTVPDPSTALGVDETPIFRIGQKVRVKPEVESPKYKWGSVTHHSVGTIIAIAQQKMLVNFPGVPRLWTGHMPEMEPVPSNQPDSGTAIFRIGQKVRVKPEVERPRHGWGAVTHQSVGTITDVNDQGVSVNFPKQSRWHGLTSEIEPAPNTGDEASDVTPTEPAGATQCKKRTDIVSNDEYAKYIRDKIQVGRMVRCCHTHEKVEEGDIGQVIKLDRDGLHDLNIQAYWQQKQGTYWVRYIHVELLGRLDAVPDPSLALGIEGRPILQIGQKVRVKPGVVRPKYDWGNITPGSVGTITAVIMQDQKVKADFPEQKAWTGHMSEMELAPLNNADPRAAIGEILKIIFS